MKMKIASHLLPVLILSLSFSACTLSSTANHWNGRVGPDGKPVYVKSHTNIGVNVLIFLPLFGATLLPKEIDVLTEEIAAENGDVVRMVESSSENYWYGFPPFTWIITPVITTVAADYEPSAEVLSKDLAEQEAERKEEAKEWPAAGTFLLVHRRRRGARMARAPRSLLALGRSGTKCASSPTGFPSPVPS